MLNKYQKTTGIGPGIGIRRVGIGPGRYQGVPERTHFGGMQTRALNDFCRLYEGRRFVQVADQTCSSSSFPMLLPSSPTAWLILIGLIQYAWHVTVLLLFILFSHSFQHCEVGILPCPSLIDEETQL